MSHSFAIHALRVILGHERYAMSQIGKPIKKVTVKPERIPIPPKTAPAPTPVEEPVETPA